MGCAIAAELAGLVLEFGLVVLVLRAVRTVTDICMMKNMISPVQLSPSWSAACKSTRITQLIRPQGPRKLQ
jgi:hypothetical protein